MDSQYEASLLHPVLLSKRGSLIAPKQVNKKGFKPIGCITIPKLFDEKDFDGFNFEPLSFIRSFMIVDAFLHGELSVSDIQARSSVLETEANNVRAG